jgi:hypothetical protein
MNVAPPGMLAREKNGEARKPRRVVFFSPEAYAACWIAESFQPSWPDPTGRTKVQTSVA